MASNRALKVADRIKEIVAGALETRVKDPRLGFITLTDVRVTGDLQQYDRTFENNGLDDFLWRLKKRGGESDSIVSFEFEKTDIQREPVVKEVLDIYDSE